MNIFTGKTTDNGKYAILSASGIIVASGVITNGEAKVIIEKLRCGIYTLQIQVGIGYDFYKIVKR